MSWMAVADSQIGDREEQQDRYLIVSSRDGQSHLLAVADGAGGHQTGALAAETAINCIHENIACLWTSDEPETLLNKLIIECNERVLAIGDQELACTTLVMVFVRGDEIFWAHVGDSRFYLIRDQKVLLKTTDHSMVELERRESAKDFDTVDSASSNKLYMCLGALTDIAPEVSSSLAREGDTLLLCSDGLWGQTEMDSLITELGESLLTNEILNKWTETARISKLNNSDNITLVAARFLNKPRLVFSPLKLVVNLFKKLRANQ